MLRFRYVPDRSKRRSSDEPNPQETEKQDRSIRCSFDESNLLQTGHSRNSKKQSFDDPNPLEAGKLPAGLGRRNSKQRSQSEERPTKSSSTSSSSSRELPRFPTSPPPYHIAVATVAASSRTPKTSEKRSESERIWRDGKERSRSFKNLQTTVPEGRTLTTTSEFEERGEADHKRAWGEERGRRKNCETMRTVASEQRTFSGSQGEGETDHERVWKEERSGSRNCHTLQTEESHTYENERFADSDRIWTEESQTDNRCNVSHTAPTTSGILKAYGRRSCSERMWTDENGSIWRLPQAQLSSQTPSTNEGQSYNDSMWNDEVFSEETVRTNTNSFRSTLQSPTQTLQYTQTSTPASNRSQFSTFQTTTTNKHYVDDNDDERWQAESRAENEEHHAMWRTTTTLQTATTVQRPEEVRDVATAWREEGGGSNSSSPVFGSDQGPDSMYGHPSSRRRKKRPIHGIKTVQVTRGRSGYGFTISGQNPCVLSCIVGGSPADVAGLKAGDYLYVVNGVNISHAPHDDVVRMVGQSTGMLELQVAENYNSSDSSEDDYPPRSKSRYPNRVRFRQPHQEGPPPSIASRPLPQRPDAKGSRSRLRHGPIGAESDLSTSVTSPGSSLSEDRSRHDSAHGFRYPTYEKIGRDPNSRYANTHRKHSESTTSAGTDVSGEFAFTTVQNGPVISTAKISSAVVKKSHSHGPHQHSQGVTARAVQDSAGADGVAGAQAADNAVGEAIHEGEGDGDNEDIVPPIDNEVRAVVGYIGSIELPGNVTRPNQRLQLLRNAVRRLRIEQKIHTLVLMDVGPEGVRLTSGVGTTIAHYSVEKLAFSGICPDDKRFFGIVTLHSSSDDVSEISSHHEERNPGSSCHVFMVDPDMCSHMLHSHKAKAFNLQCTPSPNGQRCQEFPRSPTQIILSIANLYRDRPRGALDNDIIQSHAFADPSRPPERSSSNSSNSDSGLGFCREELVAGSPPVAVSARQKPNQLSQVCIVDMPVGADGNLAGRAVTPNSRSLASLQHHLSPGLHTIPTPRGLQRPLSAFEMRRGLNNSSSSEECWGMGRTDKLTPRAMPDPTTRNLPRATSTDGLERNHSAENLRQSMQRLLQARQLQLQQDQAGSSDSESQTSNVPSHDHFSTRSAFQVPRPVSAPLRSRGRLHQAETVDMGFGKLSPRAFIHQPANVRSPSAPPIPYFPHQDSDDDDDDTESEDDPFVRRIISQFNKDRVLDFGEENPRRYSEGFALGKKREKERAEADFQKWSKTASLRRNHKMRLKHNVSQSHESLAVADGEITPGHTLVTANSVNSILQQAAAPAEESGRVAGWAVGFQRLLTDPIGLNIFTEFLKKEFSQENIVFWSAVEGYRQITDEDTRRSRAREIWNTHLSNQASDPVNVDSTARQCAEKYLENPTPTMFDVAQQQIFHLLRQDSYVRFLKSDLYKGHMMREMEGQPLTESNTDGPPSTAPDNKKKGKGKENEEKRRRSLLPWRQNKKSVKASSDTALKALGKIREGKEKEEKKEVNNNLKKAPGPGIDLSTMRKEVFNPKEVEKPEGNEQFKFCRVVMPDGSTTVVCTRPGQNIRTVLGKLCDKRGISIAAVDIFLLGSEKPLDLGEDISTLGSKEVVIERRVLFRLDMPNHKSIGVKAKPNRSIRDVFKPILNKYGYRIDSVGVQLSGMSELLDMDIPVSDIDNQRVIIIPNPDAENAADGIHPAPQATLPPRHRRTPLLFPSRVRGGKGGSLEEITNQIFDDLMKGKSELAHTFDELGVVDLERSKGHKNDEPRSLGLFGLLRKESWGARETSKKSKGKVTFALPRSDSKKNKQKAEDERLMELIEEAQTQKLQEQHVLTTDADDFPDFLCTDAVEHVDMAVHNEALLQSIAEYDPGNVDGALLPPPDMFDDVHYMHSGSRDNLHTSSHDLDDFVGQTPRPSSTTPRPSSRGEGGGSRNVSEARKADRYNAVTPRGKRSTRDVNQSARGFEGDTYLSMHPVIVDTREEKSEEQRRSKHGADSQSFSKSPTSHASDLHSFTPRTKEKIPDRSRAALTSLDEFSPRTRKTPDICDVRQSSQSVVSPESSKHAPTRRRVWEEGGSTSTSNVISPRVPVSPVSPTPRAEIDFATLSMSPTKQPSTNNAGNLTDRSQPSTSQRRSPAREGIGRQETATPRYTSPPPYSTALNMKPPSSPTKPVSSPPHKAVTLRSISSPYPAQSYQPLSAREKQNRHASGFYGARDSPRDYSLQAHFKSDAARNFSLDLIKPAGSRLDQSQGKVPHYSESPRTAVTPTPRGTNTPTPKSTAIPRLSPQDQTVSASYHKKPSEPISPHEKLKDPYVNESADPAYLVGRKLQTPDILSSQYLASGLALPRQPSPAGVPSGRMMSVMADVHQPEEYRLSPTGPGYASPNPLSQTLDPSAFSDQTVTFV